MKIVAALLLALVAAAAEPVRVILDTDMGNDVDDALALAMLHGLESRGESKLLAVTVTKDSANAAVYCDLVNHFYGRPAIPVGLVRNGKTPEPSPMIDLPSSRRTAAGAYVYPRRLSSKHDAEPAVELLRRILAAQPDQSVVVIQVGFSTNLAGLLASPGGRDLAARKVRLLSMMGGAFPGEPEYNIKMDIPAARQLFAEWPTPIVVSGYEIGQAIWFPATCIEQDFAWAENHPVAEAYRAYQPMPYDRPTWDLTAVLAGVRGPEKYFRVSPEGRITVKDNGQTDFLITRGGPHRFLILDPARKAAALRAMMELASARPQP